MMITRRLRGSRVRAGRDLRGGRHGDHDSARFLAKLAAESDTITIRIVRSHQGWHPGLEGQFVLYDFAGAPSIVLLAHYRTGAFVTEQDDVDRYKSAVDEIDRLAMSPDDSPHPHHSSGSGIGGCDMTNWTFARLGRVGAMGRAGVMGLVGWGTNAVNAALGALSALSAAFTASTTTGFGGLRQHRL